MKHPIQKAVEATLKEWYPTRGFKYEYRHEEMDEAGEEIIDVHFSEPHEVNWKSYETGTHRTCWSVWGRVIPNPQELARLKASLIIFLDDKGGYTNKMGDLYITITNGTIESVET